ncbi:MAG: hypothetical protein IJD57_03705 [Candidatus Gastranaerophilales bacterium]|nr:hypothetical protein [Candidatus Gastranaerophilales bacterium]
MLALNMKNETVKLSEKRQEEFLYLLDYICELQDIMFGLIEEIRFCILNNQMAQREISDFNYYNEEMKEKNKILLNELIKIYFQN